MTIIIAGCSKSKLDMPSPACELYQGALFKKTRRLARTKLWALRIASAKHGILLPDQETAPYDTTMADLTPAEQEAWAHLCLKQFVDHHPRRTEVHFYTGRRYYQHLAPLLRNHGYDVKTPLAGLQLGEMMQMTDWHCQSLEFQAAVHTSIEMVRKSFQPAATLQHDVTETMYQSPTFRSCRLPAPPLVTQGRVRRHPAEAAKEATDGIVRFEKSLAQAITDYEWHRVNAVDPNLQKLFYLLRGKKNVVISNLRVLYALNRYRDEMVAACDDAPFSSANQAAAVLS
ncbi:DUF6884 domain-containing protein [Ferrimonas marina]|uniref:DUF6884 domain-containing protein n=1 Tax=Ferrimonas marina TaxID=299255 RepID=A0A1M5UEC1_9GAMM|nr:DUF6884 domain-containing protein [Ferrimonas marina]SHH61003.1 hypothetical protein SAMN02745129_2515 [Ferrimonas marina]